MGKGQSFPEGDVEQLGKTPALNCPISLFTIAKLLWLLTAGWILIFVACHFLTTMSPEDSREHWTHCKCHLSLNISC